MGGHFKKYAVIFVAAGVVALPFLFKRPPPQTPWKPGDPVLVVISPHNEAIRQEFDLAFGAWHLKHYGSPVKIDWRMIGGTTEIMRYLAAEYTASAQQWFRRQNSDWPRNAAELVFDRRFNPDRPPEDATAQPAFERQKKLWQAFRASDDPAEISSHIDLFFGGGTFDHDRAARQGLTLCPWQGAPEKSAGVTNELAALRALLADIPKSNSGENWWTDEYFGTVLSAFGICYNPDRYRDLGIGAPPRVWEDLADPRLFRAVGLADPTKSGSVAKAFEMIVHEQMHRHLGAQGFAPDTIREHEKQISVAKGGGVPPELQDYQRHVADGWLRGVALVQRIGANARYFTDSAGKVPIDVASGAAAAGAVIDFFGRYQAQNSLGRTACRAWCTLRRAAGRASAPTR